LVFVLLLIVVTVTFVSLNLPLFQQILIHLGEKENQHTQNQTHKQWKLQTFN